jgi:type VI secretion system secreted protein Hcp
MALNAYLECEGKKSGAVTGSCDIKPHEGKMEVWGWHHEVTSPRDLAKGAATGKRTHKPITVTKAVDKASPVLMMFLVTNEVISTWKLMVYRPGTDTPEEEHYFTIQLENANVSAIRQEQLNNKYPDNIAHDFREHISFSYQKIIWTWESGGAVTAQDDWQTQV